MKIFNSTGRASAMYRRGLNAGLLLIAGLFATAPAFSQFKAPSAPVLAPGLPGAGPAAKPRVQLADAIIAVVNNEVITRQELLDRARLTEGRMRAQGVPLPPPAQFQRQVLERMILDRAQLQLAKEQGIKVDEMTVDRAVARIAEQNRLSVPELRRELEREGTSYARFREELRDEIVLQRLREREVDSKIQVTESEVDNFLTAEMGAKNEKEYNLAQILVRVAENASAEEIAARRKRAEEILQQLRTGADFSKAAASYSDASDALSGGDLGWRTAERLPQLFLQAIENLKPGQVTPILRSPNGFHILKLADVRVAKVDRGAVTVPQTHVRHILIKVNQLVSPEDARRKLLDLKQRLNQGAAKFEDLARAHSNDLSASKGGDLGWIYPGDTVPEFEKAMDALQPGEVSEPVQSPFGYHLIQVVDRKTDVVPKERQRLLARQAIRERKLEEATQEWLRQIRDRAYVEYRFDNVDAG